jgi:ketosteroid isomerase-like protein
MSPDVKWEPDPDWPDAGPMRGIEEVRAFTEQFTDAWGTVSFVLDEVLRESDPVVARCRWVVRGRSSGAASELAFITLIDVENDRISRARFFFDESEGLRAAGLTG